MGREFELKFQATQAQFAALQADFPHLKPIEMETTYYDSPFRRLGILHWTLRRRYENGVSVCTLKIPQEGGGKGEWEVECGNIMAAIPQLCQKGAPMELMAVTVSGVIEVCGAKFTRLAGMLDTADGTAELALDQGVLLGGGQEMPLREVEVEHKSGSEAATMQLAAFLASKYGLVPEPRSKFARALSLASNKK